MGAVKHKGNTNRANRVKGNLRPGEVKRAWSRGMGKCGGAEEG